jgi:hypothetical protein
MYLLAQTDGKQMHKMVKLITCFMEWKELKAYLVFQNYFCIIKFKIKSYLNSRAYSDSIFWVAAMCILSVFQYFKRTFCLLLLRVE